MSICRTCSKHLEIGECVNIEFKVDENKSVLDLISEWGSFSVNKDDRLPQVICKICFISVKSFANFIKLIRQSDQKFQELLSKNDSLKPEYVYKTTPVELNESTTSFKEAYRNYKDKFEDPRPNAVVAENKSKSEDVAENSEAFECMMCHKTFKKYYQYKRHMNVHTGERKYSCKICGKSFARNYVLVYHMRVHTGEKKFSCNFCDKSFIHPSNLYKHKKIHTNTRNYKCEFCSKSFIQSEALKIHIRRVHTGEKPFLCEMCSKLFSCQSSLWLHKQDTHLQKETCSVCHKQFSSRILKQHIERHKNKEQEIKKSICEQCGKHFSSDHNLRQHLLIHEGIKPYASQPLPCPLCKKSYSKRRIKSHICISSNC